MYPFQRHDEVRQSVFLMFRSLPFRAHTNSLTYPISRILFLDDPVGPVSNFVGSVVRNEWIVGLVSDFLTWLRDGDLPADVLPCVPLPYSPCVCWSSTGLSKLGDDGRAVISFLFSGGLPITETTLF